MAKPIKIWDGSQWVDVAINVPSITGHADDTTNIHGIANTADLATKNYADTAVSTHNSDSTNIHGITDTANLIYTNDSRLTDSRTPTTHASTHGSAGSDPITIAQSQVTNLTTDLSNKVDKTIIDAKGDLLVGSADNTVARQAVGENGQILMADSSATAGLRYVDPPANRNMLINGAMQVAQRGTSVTGISDNGVRTADRWKAVLVTLGTWTQSVENDAPSGSGLRKSLKMTVTTADASPAAGDIALLRQELEGLDCQRIAKGTSAAQQVTLSFWVKSNLTGTFIAYLFDNDNSRTISAAYTISQSATWERKVVTFAADTTGILDNDNNGSLFVSFGLAAGSDFTGGTLNTSWAGTTSSLLTGQTNVAAATNNYWQITGVQFETGPVATPFEFEPYEATLRKCQRYYATIFSNNQSDFQRTVSRFSLTACSANYDLPVDMRITPTIIATSNSPGVFGRIVGYDTNMNVSVVNVSSIVTGTAENSRSVTLFLNHASLSGSFVFASYDTLSAVTTVAASAEL